MTIELSGRRHSHPRRQPFPALTLTAVLGIGMCFGGALVHAYDTRLDEALAALQKAAALAQASSAGSVSAHAQHKFDNEIDKALASIQDAIDHILAAGVAAHSDGGS